MNKPTKAQRKRTLKKARDARAASRMYVREFVADARSVIPSAILVDETSYSIFDALPTDANARVATLAPAVRRTRIVRGVASAMEARATQL